MAEDERLRDKQGQIEHERLPYEEKLRRYLLGLCEPEECAEVERGIFEEEHPLLDVIEDELVEDYIVSELSEADRSLFEKRFLLSEERVEKIRLSAMLLGRQDVVESLSRRVANLQQKLSTEMPLSDELEDLSEGALQFGSFDEPYVEGLRAADSQTWKHFIVRFGWLVPAVAPILIVAASVTWWLLSTPLSGAKFAEFAVRTHRQHEQGNLVLDVRADSEEMLNEWFRATSPFSLALPASPAAPGEDRPYRLEGARLAQVAGKPAVYIAYQMQTGPAGLIVTRDSTAVATGGVQVDYKKVTFYYRMVEGYRVVTWSLQGRTYALVSHEGNNTQRSCMVCHSAMRDRDLSQTPTPLRAQPVLQ